LNTNRNRKKEGKSVMRMTRRKRLLMVLAAWYVVTYGGQRVAGPFTLLGDCTDMARIMAAKYANVSTVCQAG
jgi:hypothetical protein